MAPKLPDSIEFKAWSRRVLRPKTKLGKTTLWFGGLALILELLRLITRTPSGTLLSGWANFVLYVFIVCGLLMGLRWLRRRMLWRLRNRLIVTYTFIGVIPIILLGAMALIAGYLFAGQFATYVASARVAIGAAAPRIGQHRACAATTQPCAERHHERATCLRDRQCFGREFSPAHGDSMGRRAWVCCPSRPPGHRSPTD